MTDISTAETQPPDEGTPLADSSALLRDEARRQIVWQGRTLCFPRRLMVERGFQRNRAMPTHTGV